MTTSLPWHIENSIRKFLTQFLYYKAAIFRMITASLSDRTWAKSLKTRIQLLTFAYYANPRAWVLAALRDSDWLSVERQKWKAPRRAIYTVGKQSGVWRGQRTHPGQVTGTVSSQPQGSAQHSWEHLTGSTFMAHCKARPSELGLDFAQNTQHCTIPAGGLFWPQFTYSLLGWVGYRRSWKYKSCVWVRSSFHPHSHRGQYYTTDRDPGKQPQALLGEGK